MDKNNSYQWSAQKAMVWAWLVVEVFWAVVRLIIESIYPFELGWGLVIIAIELIYITILGFVLFVIASYPEKGIKGSTAIVAGTLLGLVWPLSMVFVGEQASWLLFLQLTTPGFFLGVFFAWLRKRHSLVGNA